MCARSSVRRETRRASQPGSLASPGGCRYARTAIESADPADTPSGMVAAPSKIPVPTAILSPTIAAIPQGAILYQRRNDEGIPLPELALISPTGIRLRTITITENINGYWPIWTSQRALGYRGTEEG